MKGGYQILDLKGTEFTIGTPALVPGAYAHCNSNGKPILITGLNGINGIDVPCGVFTCMAKVSSGLSKSYVGTITTQYTEGETANTATGVTITVTVNDNVTIDTVEVNVSTQTP